MLLLVTTQLYMYMSQCQSPPPPPLPAPPPMLSHLREYVYKIINRCEPHIYPLILPVSCIYCTSTLTSAPRVNMSSFICTVGPVLGTLPPLIRIRTQEYDSVSPERWDLRRELFLSVIYSTACIMWLLTFNGIVQMFQPIRKIQDKNWFATHGEGSVWAE